MISLISALMNSINSTIGTNKEVPLDTMINETNKKVSDLKTRLDNTSSEINEIKTIISGVENIDNDIICNLPAGHFEKGDSYQQRLGFFKNSKDNYVKEITYVAKDDGIIIFDTSFIGNMQIVYEINNSNSNNFIFNNRDNTRYNNQPINKKQSINISKDDVIKIKLQANSSDLNISIFIIKTFYNTKNASLLSKSIKRVSYGSGIGDTFYHHNVDVDKSLIILNGSYMYNDRSSSNNINSETISYQSILVSRTNNSFIINNNLYGSFYYSSDDNFYGALSWQLIEFY